MLVLSRKENERIRLGDSIVITVVRVAGDKVRLGIQAPPHIVVLRDELEAFVVAEPAAPPVAAPSLPSAGLPAVGLPTAGIVPIVTTAVA